MVDDMRNNYWQICADIGLLVIPRGLNGHSTTEWLDRGLDGGVPHEPIPWLSPQGFVVSSLGVAFWCDETSVFKHHLRLHMVHQLLNQAMAKAGVNPFHRITDERKRWLQKQLEQQNIGSGLSFSMLELLVMLDWLAAELDIAQSGDPDRSYLTEYLEYGFYCLNVIALDE